MSDAAVATVVAGVLNAIGLVIGFLTIYVKLRYGVQKAEEAASSAGTAAKVATEKSTVLEKKLDENTVLTRDGTTAAAQNAALAAQNAAKASAVAETLSNKLNGGIEEAIAAAVAPVHDALAGHAKDVADLKAGLAQLTEYVHDRNHELLNAASAQSNKIEVLLKRTNGGTKP